jgi:hypothetical protein
MTITGTLALGLGLALVRGQTTAPAASAASDLAGTWTGSARLRSAGTSSPCEYASAANAPAVTLRIVPADGRHRASLSLDLPAPSGTSCPPVRTQQEVEDVTLSGSSVAFRDGLGHEWTLGLRAGALQGLVDWKPDAPAAGAAGTIPIRLTGEVALTKVPGSRAAAAAASAAGGGKADGGKAGGGGKAAEAPKSGSGAKDVAIILGANIVGIGAFAAVNVLTNEEMDTQGQATCSPRACFFAGLSDPCVCNIEVTAGGSCFSTPSGALAGASCNSTNVPCQAGLSCNNGVCEDRGGRCPF